MKLVKVPLPLARRRHQPPLGDAMRNAGKHETIASNKTRTAAGKRLAVDECNKKRSLMLFDGMLDYINSNDMIGWNVSSNCPTMHRPISSARRVDGGCSLNLQEICIRMARVCKQHQKPQQANPTSASLSTFISPTIGITGRLSQRFLFCSKSITTFDGKSDPQKKSW